MHDRTVVRAVTLGALIAVTAFTSTQAAATQKSAAPQRTAQRTTLPAARPAPARATPRPQPTCGPPVNLVNKVMPFLHVCPV